MCFLTRKSDQLFNAIGIIASYGIENKDVIGLFSPFKMGTYFFVLVLFTIAVS